MLVTGGRGYEDADHVRAALDRIHAVTPIGVLIHGDAQGADKLAKRWARLRGVPQLPFKVTPSMWEEQGLSAGSRRNGQMLEVGKPDLVVAFPGGIGTENMIKQAGKAGVPVREEDPDE